MNDKSSLTAQTKPFVSQFNPNLMSFLPYSDEKLGLNMNVCSNVLHQDDRDFFLFNHKLVRGNYLKKCIWLIKFIYVRPQSCHGLPTWRRRMLLWVIKPRKIIIIIAIIIPPLHLSSPHSLYNSPVHCSMKRHKSVIFFITELANKPLETAYLNSVPQWPR